MSSLTVESTLDDLSRSEMDNINENIQNNSDNFHSVEDTYLSSEEIDDELNMLVNKEFSPIKSEPISSPHSTFYSINNKKVLLQTTHEDKEFSEKTEFQKAFSTDFSSISEKPIESDEELIDLNDLPETVTVLKNYSQTIYLVGTSHFSKQSHRDVRRVIRTVRPRVVMLELCQSRLCFLSMGEDEIMNEAKSLDFSKICDYIKKNGVVQGFIYTLLLTASAKITKDLDMAPGGEFRNAFNEALKIPGCTVMLGDRPVDITLRRAIATLSTWQKIKMAFNCLFSNEKLNEEELEKYKQKDVLEQLIGELSDEFPGLSEVMVRERDQYLAYSLSNACQSADPGANIVGVVGIGHSAGIKANWENVENINIKKLLIVPAKQTSKTIIFMKYSAYGLISYGVYRYVLPRFIKNYVSDLATQISNNVTRLF